MTVVEIVRQLASHETRLEEHGEALERGRDAQAELRSDVAALLAWRYWIAGGLALVALEIPIALWLATQLRHG